MHRLNWQFVRYLKRHKVKAGSMLQRHSQFNSFRMEKSDNLLEFCHQLPKVELHAHLNTSFSKQCICDLAELSTEKFDEDPQQMSINSTIDIDGCFKLMTRIQRLVQTEEAVYMLTRRVITEYAEDNVKYLELRSTPKENPETGMTRELYMRTMLRAIKDCELEGMDIVVRLLVSIDRRHGLKVGEITVDLAEKLMKETGAIVVGIDLSGDPKVGDAPDFIPLLMDAHHRGLKLALHLAELPLYKETKSVLEACAGKCNMRIGHGTFLHRYDQGKGHELIEELVIKEKIPIEACLTSNMRTLTVESLQQHHFKYWLDKSHPVVLCCDGKGVFGSNLTEEYFKAAQTFSLSKDMLKNYVLSTVNHIFDSDETKDKLMKQFKTIVSSLC